MNAAHQVFKTKQTHRLLFRDVRRLVGAVLFPTRNSRWRLSAVVALGLLITILELVTAHSFGYLINRVNDFERAQALFLTILFLIGFLGTRLFHYAHNIARLKLLNSTESEIETLSPVAETWRWPLGISAMTLMTLHARILFIGLQIITISRLFSLLYFAAYLFASVVNYVFIQRQYTVHLDFHQRRGSHHPAAASEKVITRVSAAERSAFLGFVLLPFLIATLIYEVAQDVVSLSGAVILFFSLKMFSSLSATVSSMNMQFVRAYVFVNNEFTPDRDTLKETTEPKSTEQDEKELKAGQRSAHLDGISSLGMSPTQDFAHLLATGETEYDLTEISAYHSDALSLSPSRSGRRARQATVLRTTKPALLWRVVEVKHSRHAGTLESERHFVLQDSYSGFLLYVSTEQQSANDQVFSTHVRNTFESLGKFAPVRVITMTQDVDNSYTPVELVQRLAIERTLYWSHPTRRPDSARAEICEILASKDFSIPDFLVPFCVWYNTKYYDSHRGYFLPIDLITGKGVSLMRERVRGLGLERTRSLGRQWFLPSEVQVVGEKLFFKRYTPEHFQDPIIDLEESE